MNPDQRTDLRRSLLRFLDANDTGMPTTTQHLLQLARPEGRSWLTREVLLGQLEYLKSQGLVTCEDGRLGLGGQQWRITAAGTNEYEQLANQ